MNKWRTTYNPLVLLSIQLRQSLQIHSAKRVAILFGMNEGLKHAHNLRRRDRN